MKLKNIAILVLILSIISAIGFSFYSVNQSKEIPVKNIHVSWAKYYSDIDELYENSDLVVRGIVKEVGKAYVKHPPSVISTDVTFQPIEIYTNNLNKDISSIITIEQDGGIFKGVNYKVDKVQILKKDKEYLLFLRYAEEQDKFVILTGYQGQFKINGDIAENPVKDRNLKINTLMSKIKNKK